MIESMYYSKVNIKAQHLNLSIGQLDSWTLRPMPPQKPSNEASKRSKQREKKTEIEMRFKTNLNPQQASLFDKLGVLCV